MLTSKEMEDRAEDHNIAVKHSTSFTSLDISQGFRDFWLAQAAIKAEQEQTNRILQGIWNLLGSANIYPEDY